MNGHSRSDLKLGDAQVAGIPRSPLMRLPMQINFLSQEKNPELLLPSASDRAWVGAIAQDQRRRLDEEAFSRFNQSADLSTYPRKNSVRTTRATAESPIDSHQDMNYWVLSLEPNHTWSYQPPPSHEIAWAFAFEGAPLIQNLVTDRELLVLERSGEIKISAKQHPARVLIGTGKPHSFQLVRGSNSIHTNTVSLAKGKAAIDWIGAQIQRR